LYPQSYYCRLKLQIQRLLEAGYYQLPTVSRRVVVVSFTNQWLSVS